MALETDRASNADTTEAAASAAGQSGLARISTVLHRAVRKVSAYVEVMLPRRLLTGALLRRILLANSVGLFIVCVGILYTTQYNAGLIDGKRESLRVQGEMVAAAIAGDSRIEPGRLVIETESAAGKDQARSPRRDDGFAALELSIRPERVAPILRRLIQPTTRRARVYSLDGTLILDSATLLMRGQLSRGEPAAPEGTRLRTKNFWTRLLAWIIDEELPVYREIGNANGTVYPEVRDALKGTATAMLLLTEKGEQIVSTAVPIKRAGKVQGVLLMSTPPGEIDQILAQDRNMSLTLAALAAFASIVTSLLLARTVAEPIRKLSAAADLVSRNINARHQLPKYDGRTDEVGQMARAFSAMTEALYRRIEASESFAADVAHELKNPLTAARSMAESLAYAKTEEQRKEVVHQIQNELKRLNRLITDVSNASRLDAELARQRSEPVDVTSVVDSVSGIFRDILSSDSRRVVSAIEREPFPGAYVVNGDAGRLGQVLTNLVDNAISFSPENAVVTVRVQRVGTIVELLIEDEGPGIPEDRQAIIFERFYTDRPDTEAQRGKNSGLGLSISREIVRAHNGEIKAQNRSAMPGADANARGACFSVRLPGLVQPVRGGMTSGRRTL